MADDEPRAWNPILKRMMDLVADGMVPAGRLPFGNVIAGDPRNAAGGGQQPQPGAQMIQALEAGKGAVQKGPYGEARGIAFGNLAPVMDGLSASDAAQFGQLALSSAAMQSSQTDRSAALDILGELEQEMLQSPEMVNALADIAAVQESIRSGETAVKETLDRTAIDASANQALRSLGESASRAGIGGAPEVMGAAAGINMQRGEAIQRAFNALQQRKREGLISEQNRLVGLGQTAVNMKSQIPMGIRGQQANILANTNYGQPNLVMMGGGGSTFGAGAAASAPIAFGDNSPTFTNGFTSAMRQERRTFDNQFTDQRQRQVQIGVNPQTGEPIYKTVTEEATNYHNPSGIIGLNPTLPMGVRR